MFTKVLEAGKNRLLVRALLLSLIGSVGRGDGKIKMLLLN